MKSIMSGLPVHSGDKFSWSQYAGSAEYSDFNEVTFGNRVYYDAADYGFWVKSHKTGNYVLFIFEKKVYAEIDDDEREFVCDLYKSSCGDYTIRMYND